MAVEYKYYIRRNEMNIRIRNAMQQYIVMNGPTDSRVLISIMARQFGTTKQRISGNISFMVCKVRTLSIIRNKPHSILY